MNYGRLALAAVVGTVVDGIFGFAVYGNMLQSQFGQYPGVYRPVSTNMTYMPILFSGVFLAMLAATYIYAKGFEGGSGMQEGMRFGVMLGVFAVGYSAIVGYAMTAIGHNLGIAMAVATFIEWTINGTVIGLVYKPAAGARKAAV